jgi:hypothetical protein
MSIFKILMHMAAIPKIPLHKKGDTFWVNKGKNAWPVFK